MNLTFLWVALLYLGLVALARRSAPGFRWRVAGLFYVLTLVFLFRPMTGPWVNVPADYIYSLHPWKGVARVAPDSNSEMNDVILQMVPWAHQVRESWKNLEPPLWNDAAGAGYPLLANGQSGALSIFRIAALPLPLGQSFTCEGALKILVALTFAFLFLRRRYGELASVIGAISYGFSTFLVVWLNFPHSSVAALLPALFYGMDLLFESRGRRRFTFTAVVFAFLLLNGHPESAAHSVFAAALYVLWRAVAERRWRGLASIAGAGVVGVLLALPFALPLIEALPFSQRMEMVRAHPPEVGHGGPAFLVPFWQVGFYGSMREKNIWGPGIAEVLCGYAGVLGAAAWFGILFDVVKQRRWRDPILFFLAAVPLIVAIAIGVPGITDVFHRLPLFSLAANARLRFVYCWLAAVLAAAVAQQLVEKNRPVAFATILAGAALLIVPFFTNRFPNQEALRHAIITAVPGVVVLTIAALAGLTRWRSPLLAAILVAAVTGDLWSFGISWNPVLPAKLLYPSTPLIRLLQQKEKDHNPGGVYPFRIAGTGGTFFPNSAAMFGLHDIRSHDPMSFGRYLGALRIFTGYSSYDYFAMLRNLDDPFIDYLNVAYLLTSPGESYHSERFEEIYSGTDGKVYRNRDALPRFYPARNVFVEFNPDKRFKMITANRDWANTAVLEKIHTSLAPIAGPDLLRPRPANASMAVVRILSAKTQEYRVAVDAPRWTLVVSSQPSWPGWHIYDARGRRLKLIEVNDAFMGFIVPPGESAIRVAYEPMSFSGGAYVSLTTATILLGFISWPHRRRPRGSRPL